MILNTVKNALCLTVSAAITVLSVPFAASAADRFVRNKIGVYEYEMWNLNDVGDCEFEPGEGSFTCSWKNTDDNYFSMGKNYDTLKLNYKDVPDLSLSYDLKYDPHGNSFYGAFGYTQSPLMEYYIVDGWDDLRPAAHSAVMSYGTAVVNGHEYEVFTTYRLNIPTFDGTTTIPQYWSVRKEKASIDNDTGTLHDCIDIAKHFDSWSAFGLDTSGELYSANFFIENNRSSGSAELKELVFGNGNDSSPVSVDGKYLDKNILMVSDQDGYYIRNDFNKDIGDWEPREDDMLELTNGGFNGTNALHSYRRTSDVAGPTLYLGTKTFKPGENYSFGTVVMQNTFSSVEFELVLRYISPGGTLQSITIAKAEAEQDEWTELANEHFKVDIPQGSRDLTLAVQTTRKTCDIYIDNAYAAADGTKPLSSINAAPASELPGDINLDGVIDVFDLIPLRRAILEMIANNVPAPANSDINNDGDVNVADLVCLQRFILGADDLKNSEASADTAETKTASQIKT